MERILSGKPSPVSKLIIDMAAKKTSGIITTSRTGIAIRTIFIPLAVQICLISFRAITASAEPRSLKPEVFFDARVVSVFICVLCDVLAVEFVCLRFEPV